MIVRPARLEDIDDFIRLARKAGPGFTSLAVSDDMLAERVTKSVKSFKSDTACTPDHSYLLVLENDIGAIIGMSAVKAQIGVRDPFFNFRILKVSQKSAVTDSRFDMNVLMVVNEYPGASEVGTLFVDPDYRGTGAGRLISQARYMLIAAEEERFSDTVISELRGNVRDDGCSPFWDALGRKFFQMEFTEADRISAEKDNQFIMDLMPKYPIYTALLPQEAQDVIGVTHPSGAGARRLLEDEGFRFDGVVDVFDGGPSMKVRRKDIRTVRESRIIKVTDEALPEAMQLKGLISNDDIGGFRCIFGRFSFNEQSIALSEDHRKALNVNVGEAVRIWIKR